MPNRPGNNVDVKDARESDTTTSQSEPTSTIPALFDQRIEPPECCTRRLDRTVPLTRIRHIQMSE